MTSREGYVDPWFAQGPETTQLFPAGFLGAFLQLLSLRILNDSPEKLPLLVVAPKRKEKGGRHIYLFIEHLCVLLWMWALCSQHVISSSLYENPSKLGNSVPISIGKKRLREVK